MTALREAGLPDVNRLRSLYHSAFVVRLLDCEPFDDQSRLGLPLHTKTAMSPTFWPADPQSVKEMQAIYLAILLKIQERAFAAGRHG